MTIDRRWLEDYLKGLRICNMMEEQERLMGSSYSRTKQRMWLPFLCRTKAN